MGVLSRQTIFYCSKSSKIRLLGLGKTLYPGDIKPFIGVVTPYNLE